MSTRQSCHLICRRTKRSTRIDKQLGLHDPSPTIYLSIGTNAHKVIPARRKLDSMDESSMITNGLVVFERNAMIEYDSHVIGSSNSTEGALLTNTDAVDNLGMTRDFTHRRECIKCKCMTKAIVQ